MLLYLISLEHASALYAFFVNMLVDTGAQDWVDAFIKNLQFDDVFQYAVIIDAGSSGSRVHAFKFRVPYTVIGAPMLDLVEDLYEGSRPGLSAFVDDPAKGAETIVKLIKKAEELVPMESRHVTPIVLRATAGMRRLPRGKAQDLIIHVAEAIAGLGYSTDSDSVTVMDAGDEGIYNWIAINLFCNLKPGETMAALDLGKGSTQITYELRGNDVHDYPVIDQYTVVVGNDFKVYSHSGAYRKGLTHEEIYNRCYLRVRGYVMALLDWEPLGPPKGPPADVSSFFYIVAEAGLINATTGGTTTLFKIRDATVVVCYEAKQIENPWICMNLIFIIVLLEDAYKIGDSVPIHFFHTVGGHEVSWTVGLAFITVLNRLPGTTRTQKDCIKHDPKRPGRTRHTCAYFV